MTWVRAAVGAVVLCVAPLLLVAPQEGEQAAVAAGSTSAPAAVPGPPTRAGGADPGAAPPGGGTDATATSAGLPVAGATGTLQDRVRALLRQREDAVRGHDRAAWSATVAEHTDAERHRGSAAGFRSRQASVFDRLQQLPLSTFRYDSATVLPGGAATGDGSALEVRGTYALGRYGGPRTFRVRWGLELPGHGRTAGSIRLAAAPAHRAPLAGTPPWQLPGVRVVRGRSSLVVGNVAPARLRAWARLADDAVRAVDRLWGRDWSRAPVLVVPATIGQYALLTGQTRSQAAASRVAALTTGPVEADGRATADQVVVRPGTWSELTARGRAVVVTHEVTHVATRATTTGPVPLWLSEGLADYVGYRPVPLPPDQVAAWLVARVRADDGPTRLPGDAAFGADRRGLAVSYQEAWTVCRHIAKTHGEAALVRFYRAVATGTPTRRAMREVLGVDEPQLTAAWLADLRRAAS